MKKIAILFFTFFKIGLFTFGGGYAMIALLKNEFVSRKKWISDDTFFDMVAIAESTPGPIAINCSTFVGYRRRGFVGATVATLGMILPSFVIIYFISMFLDHFLEITLVANAFRGIKTAVGILIVDAALKMIRKMKKEPVSLTIMFCSCAAMLLINFFSWNFSSVALILTAGAVGLVVFLAGGAEARKGGEKK